MTLNFSSTRSNITAENQSPKLIELRLNNNKLYLEQEIKNPDTILTFLKKENSDEKGEKPYFDSSKDENIIKEEEKQNEIDKNIFICEEKLNNIYLNWQKNIKKEILPRYGLCEKSTQTFLTSRDIDNYEAIKTSSPEELVLNLFKSSPDVIRKIYGKNLNLSAENIFSSSSATEKNIENFKSYFTSKFENVENSSNSYDNCKKFPTTSKKNSIENYNGNQELQFQNNLISRKRKIPLDYNDFNKNGLYEKNLQNEKYGNKIKVKENLNSSIENDKYVIVKNLYSAMSNEETSNTNDNLNNQKSTNQIYIKRKFDNRKKNKFKHQNVPYFHYSSNSINEKQSDINKKGRGKNKKIKNNIVDQNNHANFIIPHLQNIDKKDSGIFLSKNSSNNNFDYVNFYNNNSKEIPKTLNLNELDEPSSSKEKGLCKQKDFYSNIAEKIKNISSLNDYFFNSVNEDFSKSSCEPSIAKGISSFNEDLNEINNALGKDFTNEMEILKETETKFGRGRPKNVLGKLKVNKLLKIEFIQI